MLESLRLYYTLTILISFLVSFVSTPLMRFIAVRFKIFDHPHSAVKTHLRPVPYLGGIAIWFGFVFSLFCIRLLTQFPTGTLHNLRAILIGGLCIVILGIMDDLNPGGIDFKKKFIFQFISVLVLIFFGIHIKFIQPNYIAIIFTVIWVVGICNAFNIIDIIDGLAASIGIIASLAFFIIALPTEQIYVNFAGLALAGACLGFLPFNLSKKMRIFMGDTGSLFIGFILASLAMGTSYTKVNVIGLFAPILILGIPIFDTILVTLYRIIQNKSPFLGSKDHFALRLEAMGLSRRQILSVACIASCILSLIAYVSTRVEFTWALLLYISVLGELLLIAFWLYRIKINE